jgi:hypothetical protein
MSKNVLNPRKDGFQFFGSAATNWISGTTHAPQAPKTLQIYTKKEALSRGKRIFNDF